MKHSCFPAGIMNVVSATNGLPSISVYTHLDDLLDHASVSVPCTFHIICSPPARSLHPSAAAEELRAFISLRCCSQAVRGNDISPHPRGQQHGLLKTSPVLSSAVSSPALHVQLESRAPCSALT